MTMTKLSSFSAFVLLLTLTISNLAVINAVCFTPPYFVHQHEVGKSTKSSSITITNPNSSTTTITEIDITGENSGRFKIQDKPSLPKELKAGESLTLEISFSANSAGVSKASIEVKTGSGTYTTHLGGLAVTSGKEPSLQRIFDTFNFKVKSGMTNPGEANFPESQAKTVLLGDQVHAQTFVKAEDGPVTVEVLGAFGPTRDNPVVKFGWYESARPNTRREIFRVPNKPDVNGVTLRPITEPASDTWTFEFDPKEAAFGIWSEWPFFRSRRIFSEDRWNTFSGNLPRNVRVYPLKDSEGETIPNSYIIGTEEFHNSWDFNDIVVVIRNVKPLQTGLVLLNLDKYEVREGFERNGLSHDLLVFHNVRAGVVQSTFTFELHNNVTMRLVNGNPQSSLKIDSIQISSSKFSMINAPSFPLTLEPNKHRDITIQFTEMDGERGVRKATLTVNSNDPLHPQFRIDLHGMFMRVVEDIWELTLPEIMDGFGFNINVPPVLSEKLDQPLYDQQVRSKFWERANPREPVHVIPIAIFARPYRETGQPFVADIKSGDYSKRVSMDTRWAQTIFPALREDTSKKADLFAEPPGPFEFIVERQWGTNEDRWVTIVTFPLRDKHGRLVENTWVAAQDYILRTGCGSEQGQANCDYQDLIFILSNVKPVENYWEPKRLGSGAIDFDFSQTRQNTLQDRDNRGTGFHTTLVTDQDSKPAGNSYDKSALRLETGVSTLWIASRTGKITGKTNNLINGLSHFFSMETFPFELTLKLKEPLKKVTSSGQEVALFCGSDKDHFVKVSLTSSRVEIYAESNGQQIATSGSSLPSGASDWSSVELILLGNPITKVYQAAYRASSGGNMVIIGEPITISSGAWGRFWGSRMQAGMYAVHTGSNEFTIGVDTFVVTNDKFATPLCESDEEPVVTTGIEEPATTGEVTTGAESSTTADESNATTGSTDDDNSTTGMEEPSTTGSDDINTTTGNDDNTTTGNDDNTTTGSDDNTTTGSADTETADTNETIPQPNDSTGSREPNAVSSAEQLTKQFTVTFCILTFLLIAYF